MASSSSMALTATMRRWQCGLRACQSPFWQVMLQYQAAWQPEQRLGVVKLPHFPHALPLAAAGGDGAGESDAAAGVTITQED